MIAIILAAGKGARMGTLTEHTPKPMLTVHGKNLLEWKLEALPQEVDEVVLVVGYLKEVIQSYFGEVWNGIRIHYVEQYPINGTASALYLCKPFVQDKMLVLMGDDIYSKEDLQTLVSYEFAILVHDQGELGLTKKGQVVEKDGLMVGLNEGLTQTGIPSPLINTGAYTLGVSFFEFPPVQLNDEEIGLSNTVAAQASIIPIHVVHATQWLQITSPDCLRKAETLLPNESEILHR